MELINPIAGALALAQARRPPVLDEAVPEVNSEMLEPTDASRHVHLQRNEAQKQSRRSSTSKKKKQIGRVNQRT